MTKVVICNVFPDSNKGGAAITGETIRLAKEAWPESTINLITIPEGSEAVERSHRFTMDRFPDVVALPPLVAVPRGRLVGVRALVRSALLFVSRRSARQSPGYAAIAEADLVISKGGYVFVERRNPRRALSLWLTTLPLILASWLGKPTVVLCTTIGPYRNWYSKVLNSWILRRVTLVVPRDQFSYDEALRLGVPHHRLLLMPDIVFGHTRPDASDASAVANRLGISDRTYGVLILAKGEADEVFLPLLTVAVRDLLSTGLVERIVVPIQSSEDLPISQRFVEAFDDDRLRLLGDDLSPKDLFALYAGASFVLARRMHAAIFALVGGTPAFAFRKYGRKVEGVMASLGLGQYLVSYPDLDAGALARRVRTAVEHDASARHAVVSAVDRARAQLDALRRTLPDLLATCANPAISPPRSGLANATDALVSASASHEGWR